MRHTSGVDSCAEGAGTPGTQCAKLSRMGRHFALAVAVAGAMATAVLAIDLGACSPDSGGGVALSCKLGGGCSETQVCTGGVVGCESNCQCLGGIWQAPCPADLPQGGSSCTAQGATCGYLTQEPACGGSVDCDCQGGAWKCGPTCITPPDAGPDSAGCIASGGECLFSNVICAVPGPQSCGVNQPGSYCCFSNVADCGQPGATTYACPPAQPEGGPTCTAPPVPLGAPNYEAMVEAEDNDASYPSGCRVTFPACNNGHVPYCTCAAGSGFAAWSCF
jgi:hypothetical protein